MTLANKITVVRILLIPVFVLFAVYYGSSLADGQPQEWLRYASIAVFVAASISDLADGWVARRFHQPSRLGAILDPLADKGLLITAILTLTFSKWTYVFPLWFPILVISRDIVILVGCAVVKHLNGKLEVHPSWLGKIATALQMIALSWVMLQLPYHLYPVYAAGLFTLLSGLGYVLDGINQIRHHDEPHA